MKRLCMQAAFTGYISELRAGVSTVPMMSGAWWWNTQLHHYDWWKPERGSYTDKWRVMLLGCESVIVPDCSSSSSTFTDDLMRWRSLTYDGGFVSVNVRLCGFQVVTRRRVCQWLLSLLSCPVTPPLLCRLWLRHYRGKRMCMAELLGRAAKI